MSWLPTLPFFLDLPIRARCASSSRRFWTSWNSTSKCGRSDNVKAGMSADEARQDAVNRFGDFERIHKACRRTLLGERIMLQRVQAVLTLVLLGAVIFMGMEVYRGQRANEAADGPRGNLRSSSESVSGRFTAV